MCDVESPIQTMSGETTLRLHAEDVQVARQTREVGSVSVSITTDVRDHAIDELLTSTEVGVRRIPIGRIVDRMPESRQDGDTLIVPVVEEVAVIRFLIREEIHVTRTTSTRRHQDVVSLRTERATVARSGDGGILPPSDFPHDQEETANGQ